MIERFPYCATVTAVSVLVYVALLFKVTFARGKYNVQAPSIDGPPEFQRVYRAQINTVEQLVFFLPSLWLFASAWGDIAAGIIGIFWPIGRIIYARSYYAAAEKRGPGFGISFLPSAILLLGAIVGIVMHFVGG